MSGTSTSSPYDHGFYEEQSSTSRKSAAAVLSVVSELITPTSVLDVGCGVGPWIEEWRSRGVTDVLGVDGDYVDRAALQIPEELFVAADLTQPLNLERRFDLVQSLEVAEHVDRQYADAYVESLARHSDVILFSAAIPGQGGTHHVNEQWPSYWAPKFEAHGFELFDVLRPRLWRDNRIAVWYRQNMLLFARGAAADGLRRRALPTMHRLDIEWQSPLANRVARRLLPGRIVDRARTALRRNQGP